MTNKEKIEEFMSKIDESWGDLKKLRYICIKLCEMYEYDPKYAYATEDGKLEYMNRIYEGFFSRAEEELDSTDYESKHKICADLFKIYERLVKEIGISKEKYEAMGNGLFYSNDNGIRYYIHPVEELFCVKTKSTPKGFKAVYPSNAISDDITIMEIDKELGFIDERGYIGNMRNIVEKQNVTDADSLFERVEDVLKKGVKYLESVIGNELENVEFHKFYSQLLKTGFPNITCIVKPLASYQLEDIRYAILVKYMKGDGDECVSFLYNESTKGFERKTVEEIRTMMRKLGLLDVRSDVDSTDNICNIGR